MVQRHHAALGAALALCCALPAAHADLFEWTGSVGIDFLEPLNWNGPDGEVPDTGDDCWFAPIGAIDVVLDLDAAYEVRSVVFERGVTHFSVTGDNLELRSPSALDPALVIGTNGGSAVLHFDGAPFSEPGLLASSLILGDDVGASGSMSLGAFDSLEVVGPIVVGRQGHGHLVTSFGTQDTLSFGNATIAAASGATGHLELNSDLNIVEELRVGEGGHGVLSASSALVATPSLSVGERITANGVVDLTGSTLDVAGDAVAGILGRGEISAQYGSNVTIGGPLSLGTQRAEPFPPTVTGEGVLTVLDDSTVTIGGDLRLALLGRGAVMIDDSSSITVGGAILLPDPDQAMITYVITDPGVAPIISADGPIDAVPLRVTFAESTSLTPGDTIRLLDSATSLTAASVAIENAPANVTVTATVDATSVRLLVTARADLNHDGVVDFSDVLILIGQWGACTETPCMSDLNGDGTTDFNDLLLLLDAWN